MTLAHPAVVLPLGRLLPLAALVIGSMTPDLPVFVREWTFYHFTHSLVGVVTFDLVVTLLVLLVWDRGVRDALVDLCPDPVRLRLPARARLPLRAWLLAPLAAVVGSLSHVGWDLFTHRGRWGVTHVAWLGEQHGPLLGHQWAQHLSGVIGLAVVVAFVTTRILRRPLGEQRGPRVLPTWTLALLLALIGAYALLDGLGRAHEGMEALAFQGVVGAIVASLVVLPAAAIAWWVRRSRVA